MIPGQVKCSGFLLDKFYFIISNEAGDNMEIIEAKYRNTLLIEQLLNVWESSVIATHTFLQEKDIKNIKKYVPNLLQSVSHLIIAVNEKNLPIAFMGVEEKKLEMLFIIPGEMGKGLGKKLINYGIKNYSINELTVNEQNVQAKGFYEHIGFKVYKRTDNDEQGNSLPLLYMKFK